MKKIYNSPSTQVVCLANDNIMQIQASINRGITQRNENALVRHRSLWDDDEDEEEDY